MLQALKNLSLQAKRKANTCCQVFIPISVALVVGILQIITMGGDGGYLDGGYTSWCTTYE